MAKFFVGQRVVAIREHSQGKFRKGIEYIIRGNYKPCCTNLVDIGVIGTGILSNCVCNKIFESPDETHWFDENSFAPVELSDLTIEKLFKYEEVY